MSTISLSI